MHIREVICTAKVRESQMAGLHRSSMNSYSNLPKPFVFYHHIELNILTSVLLVSNRMEIDFGECLKLTYAATLSNTCECQTKY